MSWIITMLTATAPAKSATSPLLSSKPTRRVTCFSIIAQSDPSALPRILDLLAMFDLVPERCHVSRSDQTAGRPLLIDLQIADLAHETVHLIQKKLEWMVSTTQILCSEKRRAAA